MRLLLASATAGSAAEIKVLNANALTIAMKELAAAYTKASNKTWTMPLGFKHALFEVAADVLKRSKALETNAIREAIAATSYESIVGPVQWAKGPVPNVCTTPLVSGQWQAGAGGELELKIVNNKDAPNIKTNGQFLPL